MNKAVAEQDCDPLQRRSKTLLAHVALRSKAMRTAHPWPRMGILLTPGLARAYSGAIRAQRKSAKPRTGCHR